MKLQDAIIKALKSQENEFLSAEEVARLVNNKFPFIDGGRPTTAASIIIRARAYPQFFIISDGNIRLQEGIKGSSPDQNEEIIRLWIDLLNIFRNPIAPARSFEDYFTPIFLIFTKRLFDLNGIVVEHPLDKEKIIKTIESLTNNENFVFYKKNILPYIQGIHNELLKIIFTHLEKTKLDQSVSDQELSSALYAFIEHLAENSGSSERSGDFLIKPVYKKLIKSFVKGADGNIGSFFISGISDLELLLPYGKGKVHGFCINDRLLGIEEVFFNLGSTNLSFDIEWEDFRLEKSNALNLFLGPWDETSFLHEKLQHYFGGQIPKNGIEWKAVHWLLDHTQEGGTVVALLPSSKLNNITERHDRKYILDNHSVKLIAQLPEDFLEQSGIQATLVVIRKVKPEDKTIPMARLSKKEYVAQEKSILGYLHEGNECSFVEYISSQEIAENKWNISPGRYLHEKNYELRKFFNTTPANQLKTIREVSTDYRVGNVSSKNIGDMSLRAFTSKGSLSPVVLAKDFNQKEDEVYLKLDSLSRGVDLPYIYKGMISQPAVLFPLQGSSNRPLIFDGVGEIYLGAGVIALFPNDLVSCEFLYYQLTTVFTKVQLEKYQKGGVFTRLNQKDFLSVVINVGSGKEEQDRIVAEHFSFQQEAKEKKEKVRNEEFTIINALRHSLKQQLGAINNDISNLHKFLEKKEASGEKVSLHEPISKRSKTRTLQDIFYRISSNYASIQDSLVNMEKITTLDKSSLSLGRVKLKDFIKEEFEKLNIKEEDQVELVLRGDNVEVEIDQSIFCEVIRNLVINSRKHGFTYGSDVKNYVGFTVRKVKSENLVEVEYWDSGKGFAGGFGLEDLVRYGTGSGKTKGTGLGGFIMDRVVALHDGKLDLQVYEEGRFRSCGVSDKAFEEDTTIMFNDDDLTEEEKSFWKEEVAFPKGTKIQEATTSRYSLTIRLPLH